GRGGRRGLLGSAYLRRRGRRLGPVAAGLARAPRLWHTRPRQAPGARRPPPPRRPLRADHLSPSARGRAGTRPPPGGACRRPHPALVAARGAGGRRAGPQAPPLLV